MYIDVNANRRTVRHISSQRHIDKSITGMQTYRRVDRQLDRKKAGKQKECKDVVVIHVIARRSSPHPPDFSASRDRCR